VAEEIEGGSTPMKNEDLLKCPLLQGLDAMHRAELLGLINDSNLREKLETCMGRIECTAEAHKEPAKDTEKVSIPKEVRVWKPAGKIWPTGAKE
jgi:hypothetical protein